MFKISDLKESVSQITSLVWLNDGKSLLLCSKKYILQIEFSTGKTEQETDFFFPLLPADSSLIAPGRPRLCRKSRLLGLVWTTTALRGESCDFQLPSFTLVFFFAIPIILEEILFLLA